MICVRTWRGAPVMTRSRQAFAHGRRMYTGIFARCTALTCIPPSASGLRSSGYDPEKHCRGSHILFAPVFCILVISQIECDFQ